MAKFFKTSKNTIINLDAIQMICEIKGEQLYKQETYGQDFYEFSRIGDHIFYGVKLYDKDDVTIMKKFSLSRCRSNPDRVNVNIPSKDIKNMVVAYCIHLSAPSGGINNSHEIVYILPNDYKKLIKLIEIF